MGEHLGHPRGLGRVHSGDPEGIQASGRKAGQWGPSGGAPLSISCLSAGGSWPPRSSPVLAQLSGLGTLFSLEGLRAGLRAFLDLPEGHQHGFLGWVYFHLEQ